MASEVCPGPVTIVDAEVDMRIITGVVVVASSVCAQAVGAEPSITYTLQLGGNNGASVWTGGTPPVFDARGVVEPPGTYIAGAYQIITWSVRVTVSGDGP